MTWKDKIKEKRLPDLLLKAFLFVIILFLFDFAIGSILSYLYTKQKSGLLYRATYSMDSTKADILIFGASRANHHYIPEIFKNRMNLSCYNTGRDGETIFYNYAILKSVLKRYSPKIAILDFSGGEFAVDQEDYDRLAALIPYYKDHQEVQPIVQLKSDYEKYKLLSKIYPYNSLIFTILIGTTQFNERRDYINDQSGYVPLTEVCKRQLVIDTSFKTYEFDANKIKTFKSFVKDCVDSKVKLYIIISPVLVKYFYEDSSINLARDISKSYSIPVYNFLNDSLFFHNILFADGTHLNDSGATIFTNKVIDSIIKYQ